MAKAFPKQIFIKIDRDKDSEWFQADANANNLVDMGECAKVATYQLVEIRQAEGVAQFVKPKRTRKFKSNRQ